jgi:competence protein ComEC
MDAISDRRWGAVLAVTLSAQVATFPVLLAMGRPPTWLSIPANLLCEPLVAPATVIGFLAAVIAAFAIVPNDTLADAALALAGLVAWPGVRLADAIAWIAHRGVTTPLAVAPIRTLWALAVVVTVIVLLHRMGFGRRAFALLLALSVLVTACLPDGLQRWPQADWWYAVCDVGQGDSTVVNLGGGSVMVIDAGPDAALARRCLRALGVRRVSALFLTHFHADHVEGVTGVLQHSAVQRVYATPIREPAGEWLRVTTALGARPEELREGDRLQFGDTRVAVLWPVVEEVTGDPNNASLVLDIERGGLHLLVTGDIDPEAQALVDLPVDRYAVLKVPHHGSRFQDPSFVGRVAPALAIVSAGVGNDYGHPALETLDAYRAAGVRVVRTDLSGSIAVSVRAGAVSFATLSH